MKYNTEGFVETSVFHELAVSEKYINLLSESANMALTKNTKSQYKTAIRHIERIESELKLDMSLPFTVGKTLNYDG